MLGPKLVRILLLPDNSGELHLLVLLERLLDLGIVVVVALVLALRASLFQDVVLYLLRFLAHLRRDLSLVNLGRVVGFLVSALFVLKLVVFLAIVFQRERLIKTHDV